MATIPKPDAIVYGQFTVGDDRIVAADSLSLAAFVTRADKPVAAYRIGVIPTAGDHYVLRFRIAVTADGQTPAADSAAPGETANVYLIHEGGTRKYIADVAVPESGQAVWVDRTAPPDAAGEAVSQVDSNQRSRRQPQTGCGQNGGLCGALGMIHLALGLTGWTALKLRLRTRRR